MHDDDRPARAVLAVTLLAVLAFVAIAGVRLDVPGAYYDELHQATASFVWRGEHVDLFARGDVAGVPLFNMSYSGAIKSHVYGVWMAVTGQPWTLTSWRWLGILLGAGGIGVFGALAGAALGWRRLALVLGLVVTDATLLVCCRHDWGPAALAFLLRMAMLGLCLRPVHERERLLPLALGFLLGFAVYEKLSSVVTVVPVLVLFFAPRERRRGSTLLLVMAGGFVGALPVVLWNVAWLVSVGRLASLEETGDPAVPGVFALGELLLQCLSLPAGDLVRDFLHGRGAATWAVFAEGLAGGLVLAVAIASRDRRALLCAIGFVMTVLGLFALPSRTWVHHWTLVTPWQYVAFALALGAAQRRWLGWLCAVWLAFRVAGLATLLAAFVDGAVSWRCSPDMHRLQAFAAGSDARDLFVAADWGVGTQLLCAVQGEAGRVIERFRESDLPDTAASRLLVVGWAPGKEVFPGAFEAFCEALSSSPGWRRGELPHGLTGLRDVVVLAFERRP